MKDGKTIYRTACECGHSINHMQAEINSVRVCPACGREVLLQAPTGSRDAPFDYLCPHCDERTGMLWGICPRCGGNVFYTARRIAVLAAGGVVALLVLAVGVLGFTSPTRAERFHHAVAASHEAVLEKNWAGLYAFIQGAEYEPAAFSRRMNGLFKDVFVSRFAFSDAEMRPSGREGVSRSSFNASSGGGEITFEFAEKWKYSGGRWRLSDGGAGLFERLEKKLAEMDERRKPMIECALCKGTGRVQCKFCKGTGLLGDGTFCPKCFRSQGWKVCPACGGLGLVREKEKRPGNKD